MPDFSEANAYFTRRLDAKVNEVVRTMIRQGITVTEVDRAEIARELADNLAETMSEEDDERSYDPFKGNTTALDLHNRTIEGPETDALEEMRAEYRRILPWLDSRVPATRDAVARRLALMIKTGQLEVMANARVTVAR